jgi:hypothetical protein
MTFRSKINLLILVDLYGIVSRFAPLRGCETRNGHPGVSSKRCETLRNDRNDLTTIDECSNKWSLTGE